MKRRRQLLSSDEQYEPEIAPPKNKRRRRSRSSINNNDKENSDTTNTNSSTSSSRKNAKRKQSNLSSFFNVPEPLNENKEESDNESTSSDVSSIPDDYFYENQLKWSCNVIRGKIRRLLETPGFKITPWLKELHVNSNSYRRFMKLKGTWNGTQNGLYTAAYRYFLKQDKIKKKKQAKQKKKPLSERKKDAEKKKKLKQAKEKEMKEILNKIKKVTDNGDYDESTAKIYDDCNDVRKGITAFLKRGIMTKARFLKEIGNVQHKSCTDFMKMGPLKLSGASNHIYPKAYHWLEKLRIAEGVKKSKKRLKNEQEFPKGFELRHDDGRRWCFISERPVLKGDKIIFQRKW